MENFILHKKYQQWLNSQPWLTSECTIATSNYHYYHFCHCECCKILLLYSELSITVSQWLWTILNSGKISVINIVVVIIQLLLVFFLLHDIFHARNDPFIDEGCSSGGSMFEKCWKELLIYKIWSYPSQFYCTKKSQYKTEHHRMPLIWYQL